MGAHDEKKPAPLAGGYGAIGISNSEGHQNTAASPNLQHVALDAIRIDPDLQMREAGIDVGVVADYAQAMLENADFPAIVVYFDGTLYWPADGFHRIEASRKAGRTSILSDVREGGKRDAMLAAVGVNAFHGLRRTNADKRRSVLAMLRDPEWTRLSDREIGRRCAVDHKSVGSIRREITGAGEVPHRSTGATIPARIGGEVPQVGGSMIARMLAAASDDALVAECRRRGVEVTHA